MAFVAGGSRVIAVVFGVCGYGSGCAMMCACGLDGTMLRESETSIACILFGGKSESKGVELELESRRELWDDGIGKGDG